MSSAVIVLTWVGDVDVASMTAGRREIDDALASPGVEKLVIECAGVRFIDSTGLGTLVYAQNSAEIRGTAFVLRNVPPRMFALLKLTHLTEVLTVE